MLGGNDERCRDLLDGCHLDLLRDHIVLARNLNLIRDSILDIIRNSILLNLLSRRNRIADRIIKLMLFNLRLLRDVVEVFTR